MNLVTVSLIVAVFATFGSVEADIGGDLISTLKIVIKLCYLGGKDEPGVPEAFFACYDEAPGKSIFVNCQIAHFGGVLDNLHQINKACANIFQMIPYSGCLSRGFADSGLDMEEAVTIVNICQAGVLGIE